MTRFISTKYNGSRSFHQQVLEMINLVKEMMVLGMIMNELLLIHFTLSSLPSKYGPFQINQNTIKDKWTFDELTSMLVQEEVCLKQQGIHSINVIIQEVEKKKKKKAKKDFKKSSFKANELKNDNLAPKKELKKDKCHFCQKLGCYLKDCLKHKTWFKERY